MIRTGGSVLSKAFAHAPWLLASDATRDVIVVLSEALGPTWCVHREADCEGEVSIIVLPIADDDRPTFVLYEKDGMACVAVVRGDEWESGQDFASFPKAVAGIIAKAAELNRSEQGSRN